MTPGDAGRDRRLVALYGINARQYEALGAANENKCWICQSPVKVGGRALHLDHDHKKGKGNQKAVRGRLCFRCNTGLKWFRDNPGILRIAADYLESSMAQDVLARLAAQDMLLQ